MSRDCDNSAICRAGPHPGDLVDIMASALVRFRDWPHALATLLLSTLLTLHPYPANAGGRQSGRAQWITENTVADLERAPKWLLAGSPSLVIGDGSSPRDRLNLAGSPRRLADGGVVLVNDLHEVRYYDARGKIARIVRRPAWRNGGFRQIWSAHVLGRDSVLVFDIAQSRFTVLDDRGRSARGFEVPFRTRGQSSTALLRDGSVIAMESVLPEFTRKPQFRHYQVPLVRIAPQATRIDTLLLLPAVLYGDSSGYDLPPFGPEPLFAAAGDRVYAGYNAKYEIAVLGSGGERIGRIRVPLRSNTVTRTDIEAHQGANPRGRASAMPRSAYWNEFPAFSRLIVDRLDKLWVQRSPRPGAANSEWHIYDPAGRVRARILMPARFRPTDIGRDYILGTFRDAAGLLTVRLYDLTRS